MKTLNTNFTLHKRFLSFFHSRNSASIGSGSLRGACVLDTGGWGEEEIATRGLVTSDAAVIIVAKTSIILSLRSAQCVHRGDMLSEHEICLKLVNIRT